MRVSRNSPANGWGRILIAFTLAVFGILNAGCRTSPVSYRYFTLDMTPSGNAEASGWDVSVRRIEVAESLERRNLLVKTSPVEAEYYAKDMWLSPVEELVTEKLLCELSPQKSPAHLSAQSAPCESPNESSAQSAAGSHAQFAAANSPARTIVLSGKVFAFEQVEERQGKDALARVKLQLQFRTPNMSPSAKPLFAKLYEVTLPASHPTPPCITRSLSKALETIASQISSDLKNLRTSPALSKHLQT